MVVSMADVDSTVERIWSLSAWIMLGSDTIFAWIYIFAVIVIRFWRICPLLCVNIRFDDQLVAF